MRLIAILSLILLSACASIAKGTSQDIDLTSTPVGALCKVYSNGKMVSESTTPSWIKVDRTKYDLIIKCTKEGYKETTYTDHSGSEGYAMGNVLLGGVVGWGVDSALGADNKYDTLVNVILSKQD